MINPPLKNWKTSLLGLVGGIFIAIVEVSFTGTLTWRGAGLAALSVIKGALQKDYDSTGIGDKATKDPAKDATKPTNLAGV